METPAQKKGNYVIFAKGETAPKMVFMDETPEYITEVIKFMTSSPTFMAVPTRHISSKNPPRVIVDNPLYGIVVDVKSVSKEEAQRLISALVKTVSGKNTIPSKGPAPAKPLTVKLNLAPQLQKPPQQNKPIQQKPPVNVQTQKPQNNNQNTSPQGISIIKKPNQSKVVVLNIRQYHDPKSNPVQKPNNQPKPQPTNQKPQQKQIQKIVWQNKPQQTKPPQNQKPLQVNKPQQQNKPIQQKPQAPKTLSIRDEIRNIIRQELSNLNKKK